MLSMSAEPPDFQIPSGSFEIRLDVRWGDMDALRHVNNTLYFRYFEEARVRLFNAMDDGGFTRCPVVLAHASCDFLKPLLYPASVVVGLKLVRVGRSSMELDCWVAAAENPGTVHARGRHVIVCVDAGTQRPVAWPAAQLQALRRCFSE
jgi:acyl-CoA thioester hydrolase